MDLSPLGRDPAGSYTTAHKCGSGDACESRYGVHGFLSRGLATAGDVDWDSVIMLAQMSRYFYGEFSESPLAKIHGSADSPALITPPNELLPRGTMKPC
jgi:hypothetical protein